MREGGWNGGGRDIPSVYSSRFCPKTQPDRDSSTPLLLRLLGGGGVELYNLHNRKHRVTYGN